MWGALQNLCVHIPNQPFIIKTFYVDFEKAT